MTETAPSIIATRGYQMFPVLEPANIERIMRALILRRVGLIETGSGGPLIIGRPENGDVLRLQGFLVRNGHPHQLLDIDISSEAKSLVDRFKVKPDELPVVLC